jgi:uncharacterized protein YbbK (DUF523 family)
MGRRRVIMVSACLLGLPTRYDGKSKPFDHVIRLAEKYTLVPFCPEQLGGLPTPRPRSEINGNRVINEMGEDVTKNFLRGAKISVKIAEIVKPLVIILKSKSPSCGLRKVHDGSFTGRLVEGIGIAAEALKDAGYRLLTEEDLKDIEELYRE